MKKVIWLRDGLEIPNYGVTKTGIEVSLPRKIADEMIKRKIATDKRLSKEEKKIIGGN
jgi:hypothetical protein